MCSVVWQIGSGDMSQEQNRASPVFYPRQLQVIKLLANGLTPIQAAQKMGITVRTINGHIRKAMSRFQATTRAQLVARAVAIGLIHVELNADLKLYEITSTLVDQFRYYTWAIDDDQAKRLARKYFDQFGYSSESPLKLKILLDTSAIKK